MSIVKIDNLKDKFDPHFFIDPEKYNHSEILLRLMRRCQIYKSWLVHGPLLNLLIEKDENLCPTTIMKPFHCIDYSEPWGGVQSTFLSEQSFTILDWLIANKLIRGKNSQFDIKSFPAQAVMRLAFNIFPGGETILHKIVQKWKKIKEKVVRQENG